MLNLLISFDKMSVSVKVIGQSLRSQLLWWPTETEKQICIRNYVTAGLNLIVELSARSAKMLLNWSGWVRSFILFSMTTI